MKSKKLKRYKRRSTANHSPDDGHHEGVNVEGEKSSIL
jgi:hypothetical protein